MVETGQIGPCLHCVAGFAALPGSVGPQLCHLRVELPMVGVLVASGAGAIAKMKWSGSCHHACCSRGYRMALVASHREMRSGQGEAALLVEHDRVRRRLKAFYCMALLTLIVVRCAGELTVVRIAVAINALRKGDFVLRGRARRSMAFGAGHNGVLSFQRILR